MSNYMKLYYIWVALRIIMGEIKSVFFWKIFTNFWIMELF